ncbi:DUF6463 family protein [Paenibacillus xanthanilyticus]|uniref:DUF6463 family protein n=1 Tax=Paenibacillus xanthanilyticus TaxID=1783531 RepID=A0ABV8KDL9_9BACL
MTNHVSGLKRQMGLCLVLTGLLHTVVGLALFTPDLIPIVTEGFWDTVVGEERLIHRENAFWFMMFGFVLMLLGYAVDWMLKKLGATPPVALGWLLMATCLLGAVIMPVSGFWLGLPQAWILARR